MRDRAFNSMQQELIPFTQYPIPQRLDRIRDIFQRTRLTNLNCVYHRAYFETRYPFCSYTLVDFVQSMPIEYRISDRLYLSVINREIPKVTWVPRDKNDLLLTDHQLIGLCMVSGSSSVSI
jgi:hypothetical protein